MFRYLLLFGVLFLFSKSYSQSFSSIWNTNNTSTGSSAANQITIPTNPAFTYDYSIDWGDGNTDTGINTDITHTYAVAGSYTIQISGSFPAIYFNNTGDRNKIIEILNWGTIQWQSMENAFHGCENLNFDAIDAPDLSQVTSLRNMFRLCATFNGIVNNWDVNNITDLSGMFARAIIFNRPLDNWNTISVTDMTETFSEARDFNEPLDNWNTASVTNMSSMFSNASDFNQNINNWDVSLVTNMSGMFRNTNNFNLPLNNWNVSSVVDMSDMFQGSQYNLPLNNWDVSSVTDMSGMFSQFSRFNQNINNWNVSSVINMSDMFLRASLFNQPLANWDVSNVTNMSGMFDGFFIPMIFNQPLNTWDVSNVTSMSKMFRDCQSFNQPLDNWNVSNVTDMNLMFDSALVFNQNLSGWDVSNVTNMSGMFQETNAFNQPLNTWDVSASTNLSLMFFRASQFNLPLDNWDVSAATNFQSMFREAVFNQDISNWNTTSATNMITMFLSATSFNQNLAAWNISGVTNMSNMLSNSGLSQENYDNILIGWAAQAVTDNVNLGATNINYCDGRDARQDLIDNHNWNITGDIVNCSFVFCTQVTSPFDGDTNVPANSDIRWAPAPNATGYRVSIRRENGGTTQIIYDNQDFGNVIGLDFTNEFTPGDTVYVTVVPYNDEGPATGCPEISFTVVESWVNSPNAFKLTYDTRLQEANQTTPINQLRIQTISGLSYNYSIDWGDGQYDNNVNGEITHTYLVPEIYTISIIGAFPAPRHAEFNSDSFKLLSIDQWGTQTWESMQSAFAGCENMEYNATDIPNLSAVTDMSSMFIVCRNFNGNINSWDVSNVTNMTALFGVASIFNQPLDNWDVSNVESMSLMFFRTDAFNQNINNWDTSNVTNMARMFEDADAFNQPINNWNVSAVENMRQMFNRAQIFNQSLDNWNVSNVLDMEEMFRSTNSFNQNIDSWNVSNVTTMKGMFQSALIFNQPLNSWDVSSVENMSSMFSGAPLFNQPLNNWNVSEVTNMAAMFSSALAFNQDINSWNVTNVTNMRLMFNSAILYNQPMSGWDVNSVVDMSSMFRSTDSFNQPLNTWNVSAVANMSSMFEDAILFNQPIDVWDVSSVTLMESMFEAAQDFNQPLNNWDVSVVTNMEAMFKEAIAFNQSLNNWSTGEVLTMQEMFRGATIFNQNIENWNVSFVTTMEEMFRDASSYNQDLISWNVASVTAMNGMFQNAISFNRSLDSWNVRGVTTMQSMFQGAISFNQPLNSWRVTGVQNMNFMFQNASAYNQNMDQWDLGSVSMRSMFLNASSLNQYLGDWNIRNVSDMENMLDNTAIIRENYDNTLIAWSEQSLTNEITLGALGLPYCDALEERQSIIDTYEWTISGDVLDCPVPECTQLISPLNGATDVPVNTNLIWEEAQFARGYRLTITIQPGGTIINEVINNASSYEFATDFTGGETVFVTIIPFNDEGDATGPCIEESFTISNDPANVPDCTELSTPVANEVDVRVATDLVWNPIANADGYRITVGTTTGGNDIIDNLDVGNITTYDLPTELPESTEIFVTIIPYNEEGSALGCTEESFTTELIPVPPLCTNINNPINGATNVLIDTDLSWDAVDGATGYLVIVGITQGGIEVANNIDVGNVTTYNFPVDLQENRTHYVTIIPYNDIGDATSCLEESFRTGASTLNDPPPCTNLTTPINGASNIAIDTDVSWTAAPNADGYRLTIGTTSGGNDILDNLDVGNVITYNLAANLPENTEIFVTIIPYNTFGNATTCTEESFTTETILTVPSCTELTTPLDGAIDVSISTDLTWNAISNADGYRLTVGTTSGGNDIVDNLDVGIVTSYDIPIDLPEDTEIFVTIIPYNGVGAATGCVEESFTTETILTVPSCTVLTTPLDGAIDVSISTDLTWNAISNADGYRLTVGTTSGGNDIVDNLDVGIVTSYDIPIDLPEDTEIFVTIIPYNGVGAATGCVEESFTTETILTVPSCTVLTTPLDGAIDVSISTDLTWNAISNVDGYRLTVGTTSGGNDIVDNLDVGNITSYNIPIDLPEDTEIFVTIIPYNGVGAATGCVEESFTIEFTLADETKYGFSPDNNGINDFWEIKGIENFPNNVVTIYNRWGDMVFKVKGYDNGSRVFRGDANQKTNMGAGRLPSGTYFFDIQIEGNHNLRKTKGYVVIKR
ncbi:BspA family leucine-rich repeat surface protein [Ascidiimonas sp. W6]|uniref:BspA family leucine-rich repeat surface protein n=1 Tax=Ascidiimonas meishanensis TaxID=3128903 RepID=UPI0030ECB3C6